MKNTIILLTLISTVAHAQDLKYSIFTLTPELTKNANAVVRDHVLEINLTSQSNMRIKEKRVITILNRKGLREMDAFLSYDSDTNIKSISGKILNNLGVEQEKIKRKDFEDYSNSGISIVSDNRVLDLDYTPKGYPFTFVFETDYTSSSTAFIPRWYPISSYNVSVQSSKFILNNTAQIPLQIKTANIDSNYITNKNEQYKLEYFAKDIPSKKWETLAPSFSNIMPYVKVAPEDFQLVKVKGHATNWNEYGKWSYTNLLNGRRDLSEETITEINKLTQGETDPIEKAKLIYQYVQDKTRYISIQLGIGGWMPMLASKVDKEGYGDCKALTNYTMALMESQNIPAYYTVIYGDRNLRDIENDFVGLQGNHIILNIPNGDKNIWLECTNQKTPFGHIANFTDDRNALVIKPNGGEIVRTKTYSPEESYLKSKANINIDNTGRINASIMSLSGGIQYSSRLGILDLDNKDRQDYYKEYWDYLNDLNLENINLINNKSKIEITESLAINVPNYATVIDNQLILKPNVFNRYTNVPKRNNNRQYPVAIQRGFLDIDTYTIKIPEGYTLKSLPEAIELNSVFGTYKVDFKKTSENTIEYTRTFKLIKGQHPKEMYTKYRSFIRKVAKADKMSIAFKEQ